MLIMVEIFGFAQLVTHWKVILSDFSPIFVFYYNLINNGLYFGLVWVQRNVCFVCFDYLFFFFLSDLVSLFV